MKANRKQQEEDQMKKVEWVGKVVMTDELLEKVYAFLNEHSESMPFWSLNKERVIITEWEQDWKPSPFELRFDLAYSKGLVYVGESEREVERFKTIHLLLQLLDDNTPDLIIRPEIDFNSGFYLMVS